MPTRRISLTKQQDALVEKWIRSGAYENTSEVISDALRALRQRRKEDALKLKVLRAKLDVGLAALERREFIELDDSGLKAFLENLSAKSDKDAP